MKYLLIIITAFSLGVIWERSQMEHHIISRLEQIHIATVYEDGSWQAELKDGTELSGCFESGACHE